MNFSGTPSLSIIVPLGPGETAWSGLARELIVCAPVALREWGCVQIVLVAAEGAHARDALDRCRDSLAAAGFSACWIEAPAGRARQQNAGAREAADGTLLFLHADSRFDPGIFAALARSVSRMSRALHYFGLRFHHGPAAMRINTCGVWIRSRLMGIPFGDQGFTMSRSVFEELGGFDERLRREEDHDLVWRARARGIALAPVGASLSTSARKYADQGWFRITALYGYLTFRRAIPECARLLSRGRNR